MLRHLAVMPIDEGEYSTVTVDRRPDMWTAKISRTEISAAGIPATTSTIVNVGSISNLIESGADAEEE